MNNITKYISIFTICIALSSCISINIDQKLGVDGVSDITIQYDISELQKNMEQMADDLDATKTSEEDTISCDNFQETKDVQMTCDDSRKDEGILTLGMTYISDPTNFQKTKAGYEYNLTEVFDIIASIQNDEGGLTKESLAELQALGMKLTYNIEMPMEITSTDTGEIEGKKLHLNVFELVNKDNAKVIMTEQQAKESDTAVKQPDATKETNQVAQQDVPKEANFYNMIIAGLLFVVVLLTISLMVVVSRKS